jgi:hypothetical protein
MKRLLVCMMPFGEQGVRRKFTIVQTDAGNHKWQELRGKTVVDEGNSYATRKGAIRELGLYRRGKLKACGDAVWQPGYPPPKPWSKPTPERRVPLTLWSDPVNAKVSLHELIHRRYKTLEQLLPRFPSKAWFAWKWIAVYRRVRAL